jgi:2-polyprenyl-3-methyl-5-hydroxy-6-metoxy-1,4-benzoquinol methylase
MNEETKYYWKGKEWSNRLRLIADIIPENASVIDIGGGECNLFEKLNNPRQYVSLDKVVLNDRTIMVDFNTDDFPNLGKFQFIVCQGIIEYIVDPVVFFDNVKKYGKIMIATYRESKKLQPFRYNYFIIEEIKEIISREWTIVFSKDVKGAHKEKLFYCVKKDEIPCIDN